METKELLKLIREESKLKEEIAGLVESMTSMVLRGITIEHEEHKLEAMHQRLGYIEEVLDKELK